MDVNLGSIFTALFIALIGWFSKVLYDKFFSVRPKLYTHVNAILYGQRNDHYSRFNLDWSCEITIKNNSKFTAQNIEIIFPKGHNISSLPSDHLISRYNHLNSYDNLNFETKIEIIIPYEDIANVVWEQGQMVVYPGLKINNPDEHFRPKSITKILFILKYESDRGKSFYTVFKRNNGKEQNHFYLYYPFWIH